MQIILTDKDFSGYDFPENVVWKKIDGKLLSSYDGNKDVVAIAGSRAMSVVASQLNFPSLKLFQLTSAGFDNVPLDTFKKNQVAVANAGTTYSAPIAETVVFGMLFMAKKLRKNPNNRRFKLARGYVEITELTDKKVLIMGAGNIGTAVAERLQGFQMRIDGYDPYCPEKQQYHTILRSREALLKNIGEYDYIVSTMPDNEQTQGFINAELFASMKPTVVIVNVGRKAVFNQDDFYNALRKKHLGGAVLDMFEKIPNPITNKFRRLKNVVVLPGVAAISQEVNVRLKEHIYRNFLAVLKNGTISNVINGVK